MFGSAHMLNSDVNGRKFPDINRYIPGSTDSIPFSGPQSTNCGSRERMTKKKPPVCIMTLIYFDTIYYDLLVGNVFSMFCLGLLNCYLDMWVFYLDMFRL